MGKTRTTDRRTAHKLASKKQKRQQDAPKYDPEAASKLLEEAQFAMSTGDLENALSSTRKALKSLLPPNTRSPCLEQLPAFEVMGAIYIEMGDPDQARSQFTSAASVDPTGEYAGAEKFLWLAQLSEEGGQDTIKWFEKGVTCLRAQLAAASGVVKSNEEADEKTEEDNDEEEEVDESTMLREKLSNALCGAAEVYMTDLSFEDDCEEKCEELVNEAVEIDPENPAVLQTLANMRISQQRIEEAKAALEKSMSIWEPQLKDLEDGCEDEEEEDNEVPEFAARISLCRLLIEVDMCERALGVSERLVREDDSSVEAWYLGGWCQHLLSSNAEAKVSKNWARGCRRWLSRCLLEFDKQAYEDDRLHEHAKELKADVDSTLGPAQDDEDDEVEWEDEDDDDQAMAGT